MSSGRGLDPAYYEWKDREGAGPSEADREEACVVAEMQAIHEELDETYGSPRMTKELRRRGFCVNHKRVERLMALNGIVGVTPRRSVRTTIRSELSPPLPDLIGGDFSPGEPNRRYCGDITYVPTGEGWLYLASVLDLGSRRLAGWNMADHMRSELVEVALERACELRGCLAGATFHSDRGSQGGFNRSSQHLTIAEVFDGSSSDGSRSRSAAGDAITGASTTPARDRATVLDGDRQGTHADRGSRRRRSFAASRPTLVSQRRRHGAIRFGSAVRPLPLVS